MTSVAKQRLRDICHPEFGAGTREEIIVLCQPIFFPVTIAIKDLALYHHCWMAKCILEQHCRLQFGFVVWPTHDTGYALAKFREPAPAYVGTGHIEICKLTNESFRNADVVCIHTGYVSPRCRIQTPIQRIDNSSIGFLPNEANPNCVGFVSPRFDQLGAGVCGTVVNYYNFGMCMSGRIKRAG